MTPDQHTELIEFLDEWFVQIDARFDAIDQVLTRIEISHARHRAEFNALVETLPRPTSHSVATGFESIA